MKTFGKKVVLSGDGSVGSSYACARGWHVDGRASAVVGTHTDIQTADERILPKGTGDITDVGMTGFYVGILGLNKTEVIERFITSLQQRHVDPN